jgi:beta-glucosidase
MLLVAASAVGCGGSLEQWEAGTAAGAEADAVESLLARMTLAEKIGQMTQPDHEFLRDPSEIAELFLGSVLSGGSSDPADGNSLQAWTEMYEAYQRVALETRLRIPILYGVDAVHGHSNVLGAVIFPHNIGLGATRDPDLVRRIAEITGAEMRATGIQWNFAPAVSVPRDERWGRTYEGFSEDPALVAEMGVAAVQGYQRGDLRHPLAVLATAKHYLGDGGTVPGTSALGDAGLDQGDMPLPEAEMRRIHLHPYPPAVAAGVGTIMPSYSSWNGRKISGDRYLLTDVLKGELGFEGFLISDFNAIQQLDPDFKRAVELSINAGMDMAMMPRDYRRFIEALTELVEEGSVPESRIDDAVRRILRVKAAMGLLDDDVDPFADRSLHATFGSAEHRATAREAVRKSLVLLKNDGATLPLGRGADQGRIHVAGQAADDIGIQCGGWTIDWQGGRGEITPGGTTILAGIRAAAGPGAAVTYSVDGAGAEGAEVAIVVIGEEPYAEYEGDKLDLSLDPDHVALVRRVADAGVPVVVVLVSGRPMILDEVLDRADALVAAWLPGTEGAGVADVLFGDHPPTGTLSFTWPRSMEQIPLNVGDPDYDPLFPFGFGLSY